MSPPDEQALAGSAAVLDPANRYRSVAELLAAAQAAGLISADDPHSGQPEPQHQLVPNATLGSVAGRQEPAVGLVLSEAGFFPSNLPYSGGVARSGLSRLPSSSTSAVPASPWRTHHRRNVQALARRPRRVLLARAWATHRFTAASVSARGWAAPANVNRADSSALY